VSGHAAERLVSPDLLAVAVAADDGSAALATASAELGTFAGCEVGLWEAGPGVDVDTEADELFLVLAGRGEVAFEDGSVLTLAPGALVRLRAGDRTTWTIQERLRKLYLAPS
jgi:uncharacterized cupin superfamily protein